MVLQFHGFTVPIYFQGNNGTMKQQNYLNLLFRF